MKPKWWRQAVSGKALVLAEVLAMRWELELVLKRAIMLEMGLELELAKLEQGWKLEMGLELELAKVKSRKQWQLQW
jgi:hypothetical protein